MDDFRAHLEDAGVQSRALRAIARSLVLDDATAEDILQEAWLKAVTQPPREAGALMPWMRRVVKNLALNQLRGDRNRNRRRQSGLAAKGSQSALLRMVCAP